MDGEDRQARRDLRGQSDARCEDPAEPGEDLNMPCALVSPGYFATLRMPLAQGRDFDARDDASGAPVMIVNQAFEQRYYAGRSAMGRL